MGTQMETAALVDEDKIIHDIIAGQREASKSSILLPNKPSTPNPSKTAGLLPSQVAYLSAKAEGRSQLEIDQARIREDESRQKLRDILHRPGNNECCDCTEPLSDIASAWAVLPHGIFVCLDCAQVHRSLGTHISKVKGVHLDLWQEAELRVVDEVGNAVAAAAFDLLGVQPKIERTASQQAKIQAANTKYNGRCRLNFVGAKEAHAKGFTRKEKRVSPTHRTVQDQIDHLAERVTHLEEHVGIATGGCEDMGSKNTRVDISDSEQHESKLASATTPSKEAIKPSNVSAAPTSDAFFAEFGL